MITSMITFATLYPCRNPLGALPSIHQLCSPLRALFIERKSLENPADGHMK